MKHKTKKDKDASRFTVHASRFRLHVSGFTLLETLAAVSVLTFAVTGPLSLAYFSIRSASVSQNQFVAFYLAQEAIEYIKNRRDNNALTGAAEWLDGLGPCRGSQGCVIDVPNNQIQNCNPCPKVKYDNTTGFYNHSSGVDTLFTREVKLSDLSSYESKVTVIISWQERFGAKSFTLEENILNWP